MQQKLVQSASSVEKTLSVLGDRGKKTAVSQRRFALTGWLGFLGGLIGHPQGIRDLCLSTKAKT
jgi:hypothetical protein